MSTTSLTFTHSQSLLQQHLNVKRTLPPLVKTNLAMYEIETEMLSLDTTLFCVAFEYEIIRTQADIVIISS